jgi:hypothetical protein
MKYNKIKVQGVVYKYYIDENNKLSFKGIVTYPELQRIKERLIKRGLLSEEDISYDEWLKKKFEKWSTVELKLQKEEYDKKEEVIPVTDEFKEEVKKELERRMKSDS